MANNNLVAVTGCAGFIGSHLSEKLISEGYKVIGIDNFSPYYDRSLKERNLDTFVNHENFDFYEADLTDYNLKDLFKGVSTVYHLAAQAGVRYSWEDFQQYVNDNIIATQKILESCKENSCKLVFASSSSVYGDAELPEKEDMDLNPISPYGLTKKSCEELIKIYHDTFGLKAALLRYFTVYGPRQRPDMAINKFTGKVLNEEEITIYGDGEQSRDFSYVEDIIDGTHSAGKKDIDFDIFNLGTGHKITVNKLVELLSNEAGVEPKIKHIEEQPGDVKHTLADTSKAEKKLDYKPSVKIEEGIKLYLNWYKKEGMK
ncbi:MAG: GDP-mannose 4,6-dehydratase [Candidatus Undinarchaeales archaeon]